MITIFPPLKKLRSFNCMSPPPSVRVIAPSHIGLLSLSNTLNQLAVPELSTVMPDVVSPSAVAMPLDAEPNAGLLSGIVTSLTELLTGTSGVVGRGAVNIPMYPLLFSVPWSTRLTIASQAADLPRNDKPIAILGLLDVINYVRRGLVVLFVLV